MKMRARIATLLVVLGLALPALAMNLNEAMGALSGAKARGQLGEMPNGYIGVVGAGDHAEEIARLINQARRAEYQRLARENGIKLGDVEAIAGQKALEKTPRGQYIQLNGKWIRK
ncbi:YdbL family probable chaperone protein [Azotobacter salinestris]|uniref:YdbL family protein n=1 Tax=Azotobacter salinestris TaxID=69964 RepID=UPI001266B9EA|nr:YdbL family protein [Azotobacter salinestris]